MDELDRVGLVSESRLQGAIRPACSACHEFRGNGTVFIPVGLGVTFNSIDRDLGWRVRADPPVGEIGQRRQGEGGVAFHGDEAALRR